MLSSKPKCGAVDTSNNKTTPVTPKVNRISRTGLTKSGFPSASPLQNSRSFINRSPKSVDSKSTVERRSPKTITPPDKQPRALKASELQVQLVAVQEELKKARGKLVSIEQEKAQALEELKDAKSSADGANEKLNEVLLGKKRAEESSEREKFRANKLEQAGIEATRQLQRVKRRLALACNAKKIALSNTNDSMKIVETNGEKMESLFREVSRMKSLLDSKMESINYETAEIVRKWDSKVDGLIHEYNRAKATEEKLVMVELEGLRGALTDAKRAETDACKLADEWKRKAKLLEVHVEESTQLEKSLDYLASMREQLDESNSQLQDAETEISALKGKVESLKIEVARYKADLEESNMHLEKMVEDFGSKFQILEEEKLWALNSVNTAASDIETLREERSRLINELENAMDEEKKAKKAMEGLASALHEVSTESKETQEMLLSKQVELEDTLTEIEEIRLALKNAEERYGVVLDEARYEIVCLRNAIERYKTEVETSRAEGDAIKRSEAELADLKVELGKVTDLLKGVVLEAHTAREDGVQMLAKLREAQSRAAAANEAEEEARGEILRLKERLSCKDKENNDLHIQEAAALEKVKELTLLLLEVTGKKVEQNCNMSNRRNVYDLLPETMKFHEEITASERGRKEETMDDVLESKMDSSSLEWTNKRQVSPSRSLQKKKKKAFLHKLRSLLKKGNQK